MKVYWTDTALNHLTAIYNYISLDSQDYAKRIVDRLTKRSQQIVNFPYSGRVVPEFEKESVREVIEGSYRIIYILYHDKIDILAVIHGSRKINPDCKVFLPES